MSATSGRLVETDGMIYVAGVGGEVLATAMRVGIGRWRVRFGPPGRLARERFVFRRRAARRLLQRVVKP